MKSVFSTLVNFYLIFFAVIPVEKDHIFKVEAADANGDAKAIVDSKFDPKIVAGILLFRTQEQCSAINQAVAAINGGKPLVDARYLPVQGTKPYDDLVFALVSDPMTIFSRYLAQYMERADETLIIMLFIQVDDREKLKQVYLDHFQVSFDIGVESQRKPFMNAFRVWAEANRKPPESSCGIGFSCSHGQELVHEVPLWNNKKKDDLEFITMKQAIVDSQDSIGCYGSSTPPPYPNLIDDIKNNIENHDLVDLYTSLVNYIQNHDSYFATKLHQYCDGSEGWTMWIVLLTTRRGKVVTVMDDEFKKLYKISLIDFIKTCKIDDVQFKDMLTVLVDPKSAPQRQPSS